MRVRADTIASWACAGCAATLVLVAAPAIADVPFNTTLPHVAPPSGKGPQILVAGKTRAPFKLAVPALGGDKDISSAVLETATRDFGQSTVFTLLDPKDFRANLVAEGMTVDPKQWRDVGAEGVVKGHGSFRGGRIHLELKLFVLARGTDAALERVIDVAPAELRGAIHQFDNDVVKTFTQRAASFGTRLVFSATIGERQKGVFRIDSDGEGLTRLAADTNIAMAPAFSQGSVYYTGYAPHTGYSLYRIGNPAAVLAAPGPVFGVAFSNPASGVAKMALVIAQNRQSEIYVGNADGTSLAKVTNGGLNTHPSFGPNGQLAYTSNQGGNPQVYVAGKRVSARGTYNMAPTWCADPDGLKIVFMGRDGASWDIFSVDPSGAAESMTRLTQDQASNTYPACSPDGRTLAFFSSRASGGLMTMDTRGQNARKLAGVSGESLRWEGN